MSTASTQTTSATLPALAAGFRTSVPIRGRYDNWIAGKYTAPVRGKYFVNPTPITGQPLCEVARSTAEDIDLALDAAHAAAISWNTTSPGYRANLLNRIADRLEANLDTMAFIETIDNGKPIRETTHADMPLAVDHFRYFAGAIRAQEGGISEIDHDTVAYHFHEPLGVVGQIIPWNFPLLMAVWKLAPALAAGNCVVLKPAEQTPVSIMAFMELIADILPSGVDQRRAGFRRRGREAAGLEPEDREDRVHRRNDHRAVDHAVRLGEPDSGHARAGWQVAQRLLRRRHGVPTTTSSTRRSRASRCSP